MNPKEKSVRVNRVDFGLNITKSSESKKSTFSGSKTNTRKTKRELLYIALKLIQKGIRSFFRFVKTFFSRLKWNISRSIFLGRGVYFKYISNLALLLVIVFGAFVYLGSDRNRQSFISKYSGVSAVNDKVYSVSGSQTFVASKEFRVTQYSVNGGDTLSSIAAKYSNEENTLTVDTIMWANNLKQDSILRPGMLLDIPPVQGVLHVVKKGDTVNELAKKYNLITDKSSQEERNGAAQRIVDINTLDVKVVQTSTGETRIPELIEGNRIIIPGGVIIQETPKVATAPLAQTSTRSNVPVTAVKNTNGIILAWPVAGNVGLMSNWYSSYHRAVDIAYGSSWTGPQLVAMSEGTVTSMRWEKGGGANVVRVSYDNGISALYAHLSVFEPQISAKLAAGQQVRVKTGDVLGRMGCTGTCTGPHLHLELQYRGSFVNPCSYLPRCK